MAIVIDIPQGSSRVIDIPNKGGLAIGAPIGNTNSSFTGAVLYQGANNTIAITPSFYFNSTSNNLNVISATIPTIYANTIAYPGSDISINMASALMIDASNVTSINWLNRILYDAAEILSIDWAQGFIYDRTPNISIDYTNRKLYDNTGTEALDYSTQTISFPNASTTTGGGVGTLTNVPGTTSGGDPTGYWTLIIGGTTSYVPYWT